MGELSTLNSNMMAPEDIDFAQPQSTIAVNGFPLSFRPVTLAEDSVVWVPRGISRNEPGKCWRVYAVGEEGVIEDNFADAEHDSSPLASLKSAYRSLTNHHQCSTSRFVVDNRARSPGFERDPLIDSGVSGVFVSRSSRKDYKIINVVAQVTMQDSHGDLSYQNYYAGGISERSAPTSQGAQQQQFESLIQRAVVVRRYYNQLRSNGLYPRKVITYDDVPDAIRQQPVTIPDHLDLVEILDSYVVREWTPVIRTTGGDEVKLTVELQNHNPASPHKNVWLNGFQLKFKRGVHEGRTLYLPRYLYRARGEWRIRIIHKDGIALEAVSDEEAGGWTESLNQAWTFLFSELRQLVAPEPSTKRYARNELLDTGIRLANIMPARRLTKKDRSPYWTFSLGFSLPHNGVDPVHCRKTMSTWRLSKITDEQIREDLIKAAAISAYRQHLIETSSKAQAYAVDRNTPIPERFYPSEPPNPITVDDLKYFTE